MRSGACRLNAGRRGNRAFGVEMSLFPPNTSTNPAGRLGRWRARRGEDCHGCRRGMLAGGSRSASRVALGLLAVLVTSSSAAATAATPASATTTTHTLTVTVRLLKSAPPRSRFPGASLRARMRAEQCWATRAARRRVRSRARRLAEPGSARRERPAGQGSESRRADSNRGPFITRERQVRDARPLGGTGRQSLAGK